MNAGTIVEIALGLPALIGGGIVAVSKLTRIAVAVEQGAEAIKAVAAKVEDHEKRLSKGGL